MSPHLFGKLLSIIDDTHDIIIDARAAQQYMAQQAQLAQQAYPLPPPPPTLSIHAKALHMLKIRLAGLDSTFHLTNDEFLVCHVANDTVYIFFVINGKAGVTQEAVPLFPSDKLITQFRIIR